MRNLAEIAVTLWLGAMAFFAFVAAPAAFATLEREAAGRFVGAVFPRYYAIGLALGLVALTGLGGRRLFAGGRPWDWLPILLVLVMLVLTLYAWAVVLPAAHAAREAMRRGPAPAAPAEVERFSRLHRRSAILNGAVMLAGVAFVALQAARRP
jgi:uncharacterized membrane protein